jgi:hypothetical protein
MLNRQLLDGPRKTCFARSTNVCALPQCQMIIGYFKSTAA